MAQNRSSQRGVLKIASSLLLAGLGALLSVAGCAADDGSIATVTEEAPGESSEAVVCGNTTCNVDNCTAYKCSLNSCILSSQKRDGEACLTIGGGSGLCITLMEGQSPICCTGCVQRSKLGGYICRPGDGLAACGSGGGACESCVSADKCVAAECVPGKFACDANPIPDGKPCSDGSGICQKGACCTGCFDGGVCQPGTDVKLCGAGGADKCENCDDGNPCTDDICGPKGCEHPPVEAGKSCDTDTNLCNGTAKCDGAVCKTTPAVVCNDGNPCTNDACTPGTGQCVYTNNTANCSDGNVCTLVDKCSGGACVGTGEPNCNDNEACTTDTCDKTLGCQHKAVAENTLCDDGNACSTGDKCVAGKCSFVAGKDCNDNNPCTTDACAANVCGPIAEANGTPCVFDRCHINSECQAGKCTEGSLVNCDDGNPCTTDSCDAATGCKHVNADGVACSDGDLCTVEDKCAGGKCAGKEMTCTPIDDCHLGGTCNTKTGTCDDPRAPDDTECEGGTGRCLTGKCDVPTGEGGAGGDSAGQGGDGASGSSAEGGSPTGEGGDGNAPSTGGEGANPSGGKGGTGNGNEAGEAVDPARVFQRQPGGCSCRVPTSPQPGLGWVAGLGAMALFAARRRARGTTAHGAR
ncbi:MAG: hypothetical protein EOO73_30460 [Myxococcales bacterium]|nr:MAG: hypothetical protein EOO73_30460 [Myxococcales bacterium]